MVKMEMRKMYNFHVFIPLKGKALKKINEVYEPANNISDSMALLVSEGASTISTPSSISSTTLSETGSERAKDSINQQDLVADKKDVRSGQVENDSSLY